MKHTDDSFIRSTFHSYLVPSICALLGTTITGLLESLIAGNFIGTQGLAAINIAKPVYFTFATMGALICVGAATNASVCIGKEDEDGCREFSSIAIIASLALSALVSVLGICFLPSILKLLGARGELYEMVHQYAFYMMAGGVTIVLMYYPFNFLRVAGRPRQGVIMFLIMAILNLILDLVFVLVLKQGISGMALAAIISTGTADIIGFLFLRFPRNSFPFRFPQKWGDKLKKTVVTGSSMALNNLCNIFRTLFINQILLSGLGQDSVTAFAVTATVANFIVAVISGVSQTLTPLIGVFYGEKDISSMKQTMGCAFRYGGGIIAVISVLLVIGASPVCRLFGVRQEDVLRIAEISLILYSISLIPAMVNNIFIFLFFTTDRTLLANLMTLSRAFLFVVLPVAWFASKGEQYLVWTGFLIAELVTMVILAVWTQAVRHKNPDLSRLTLFDNTYERDGHYLSFSVINDQEKAMEASQTIGEFCEAQNLQPRTAMMISLSLEEMLLLIFQHCFEEGEQQTVDIRIFILEETVVLRMRNAGHIFDPVSYYEKRTREAGAEELLMDDTLGIKMIVKQADVVLFKRTFGVNNLTILLGNQKDRQKGKRKYGAAQQG